MSYEFTIQIQAKLFLRAAVSYFSFRLFVAFIDLLDAA